MRGKRCRPEYRPHAHRIIPARAGQTSSIWRDSSASTDHPRACGANYAVNPSPPARTGSSPRVRGKLFLPFFACAGIRIIPARAGQTRRTGTGEAACADHPRACGANTSVCSRWSTGVGSSPRVRGKPRPRRFCVVRVRIIPARAGQTSRCRTPL